MRVSVINRMVGIGAVVVALGLANDAAAQTRKCCLYQTSAGERLALCTTDATCSTVTGYTKIAEFGVANCATDCYPAGTGSTGDDALVDRVLPSKVGSLLEELNQADLYAQTIKDLLDRWGPRLSDGGRPPLGPLSDANTQVVERLRATRAAAEKLKELVGQARRPEAPSTPKR